MKKLFASSLLTVVAVPFLMAAPAATKNAPQNSDTATTAKKTHKKKVKKSATGTTASSTNSTSTK